MPAKGTHTPRAPISDPRDPHGWHGLTETFCEWMAVQNYSPKTVDNRRKAFEGALWILRTGAPWQDLPPRYGPYQTVHRRFQNWVRSGVNERVLLALAEHPSRRRLGFARMFCGRNAGFLLPTNGAHRI